MCVVWPEPCFPSAWGDVRAPLSSLAFKLQGEDANGIIDIRGDLTRKISRTLPAWSCLQSMQLTREQPLVKDMARSAGARNRRLSTSVQSAEVKVVSVARGRLHK